MTTYYESPVSGENFMSVAGGASYEAQAFLNRGARVIICMHGLPYNCTPKQVIEFFASGEQPCAVHGGTDGVLFVKKQDGRPTGNAFVLFSEESDASKALARHCALIGARYIELFRSTAAEMLQVIYRSVEPVTYELPEPLPLVPQHMITSGTREDCLRLRGMPYGAKVKHVLDFLGEHAKYIMFQGVHMVINVHGESIGEAFIRMNSKHSAFMTARYRHNRYMQFGKKLRYVEVIQCSGDDMNSVLSGGTPARVPPPSFSAYDPGQIAAAPPIGPQQFDPPPIYNWPYPSPSTSPTSYCASVLPPRPRQYLEEVQY